MRTGENRENGARCAPVVLPPAATGRRSWTAVFVNRQSAPIGLEPVLDVRFNPDSRRSKQFRPVPGGLR